MIVRDHRPHAWFLLEDDGALFLDAACTHSFLDYSVLIALDDQEVRGFETRGRAFLDQLAREIHDSAPAARESRSPYKARNLTLARGGEVLEAVRLWRADRNA